MLTQRDLVFKNPGRYFDNMARNGMSPSLLNVGLLTFHDHRDTKFNIGRKGRMQTVKVNR